MEINPDPFELDKKMAEYFKTKLLADIRTHLKNNKHSIRYSPDCKWQIRFEFKLLPPSWISVQRIGLINGIYNSFILEKTTQQAIMNFNNLVKNFCAEKEQKDLQLIVPITTFTIHIKRSEFEDQIHFLFHLLEFLVQLHDSVVYGISIGATRYRKFTTKSPHELKDVIVNNILSDKYHRDKPHSIFSDCGLILGGYSGDNITFIIRDEESRKIISRAMERAEYPRLLREAVLERFIESRS